MYILYLIYEIFIYNKYMFTFVCKYIHPIGYFPLGTPDWYRWCHSSWSIRSDSHWAWQWPKEWFSPDPYLYLERSDVLSRASNRRYKKPSLRLTTRPGYPRKCKTPCLICLPWCQWDLEGHRDFPSKAPVLQEESQGSDNDRPGVTIFSVQSESVLSKLAIS